ncbi:hypothetical protein MQC31_02935, partial [Escherichia coli]|nr:hypothetical protein [Escherichia coli]
IAIRENMGRERIRSEVLRHQHPGMSFGFVKFHYYQRLTSIGKGCHSVILTIINYYSPLFSIQIL